MECRFLLSNVEQKLQSRRSRLLDDERDVLRVLAAAAATAATVAESAKRPGERGRTLTR